MMGRLPFITVLILFMAWGIPSYADIYKYVDENGVAYYTNTPSGKAYKKFISYGHSRNSTKPHVKNTSNYNQIIYSKSKKYNIEPSLIKAVIKTESNWDPGVVSRRGAIGLMQLMPFTAKEMGVKNPFNPEENIEGGIKYLRYLLDKFNGDLTLALAAYNAGPKTIEKAGGIPHIQETQKYVKRVLSIYYNDSSEFRGASTPIYKVVFNDNTVLYTNTPLDYEGSRLSRF